MIEAWVRDEANLSSSYDLLPISWPFRCSHTLKYGQCMIGLQAPSWERCHSMLSHCRIQSDGLWQHLSQLVNSQHGRVASQLNGFICSNRTSAGIRSCSMQHYITNSDICQPKHKAASLALTSHQISSLFLKLTQVQENLQHKACMQTLVMRCTDLASCQGQWYFLGVHVQDAVHLSLA